MVFQCDVEHVKKWLIFDIKPCFIESGFVIITAVLEKDMTIFWDSSHLTRDRMGPIKMLMDWTPIYLEDATWKHLTQDAG